MFSDKTVLPSKEQALPGRSDSMQVSSSHYVYRGHSLVEPFQPVEQRFYLVVELTDKLVQHFFLTTCNRNGCFGS